MKVPESGLGKVLACTSCGKKQTLTQANTEPFREDATPRKATAAPANKPKRRIGEMLIEAGVLTQKQLDEALRAQGSHTGKIVDTLISMGYLTPEAFVRFLASQPGVASIDLSNYEVPKNLLSLVPRDFAVQHEVFPIDKMGRLLTLGMVCPLDSKSISELENLTGLNVKPLLCAPQDIREAIRRYYPSTADATETEDALPQQHFARLLGVMRLTSVIELVRQISTLPALPETVTRVRDAMVNPLSSVAEVGEIIKMDPPIAAKVLSVSNSAAYGFPSRVDDVVLAVTLLGLRETYSIVLSAAVIDFFEKSRRFDYKSFWLDAMCCAAAARITAKICGRAQISGVFTAGLLHDIGRVALAEVAGERYAQISPKMFGQDLIAAEERVFGLAHPEAGYELATHWSLPAPISECIRFHHHPDRASEANRDIVAIVSVASAMAYASNDGEMDFDRFVETRKNALEILDMDRSAAETAFEEFQSRRDSALKPL